MDGIILCCNDRKTAKMFCDGVLKAEDKDFPIHKCLIGLVSDVLGNMFSSEVCIFSQYFSVLDLSDISPFPIISR